MEIAIVKIVDDSKVVVNKVNDRKQYSKYSGRYKLIVNLYYII